MHAERSDSPLIDAPSELEAVVMMVLLSGDHVLWSRAELEREVAGARGNPVDDPDARREANDPTQRHLGQIPRVAVALPMTRPGGPGRLRAVSKPNNAAARPALGWLGRGTRKEPRFYAFGT
jgi:hypothetical protein